MQSAGSDKEARLAQKIKQLEEEMAALKKHYEEKLRAEQNANQDTLRSTIEQ